MLRLSRPVLFYEQKHCCETLNRGFPFSAGEIESKAKYVRVFAGSWPPDNAQLGHGFQRA